MYVMHSTLLSDVGEMMIDKQIDILQHGSIWQEARKVYVRN